MFRMLGADSRKRTFYWLFVFYSENPAVGSRRSLQSPIARGEERPFPVVGGARDPVLQGLCLERNWFPRRPCGRGLVRPFPWGCELPPFPIPEMTDSRLTSPLGLGWQACPLPTQEHHKTTDRKNWRSSRADCESTSLHKPSIILSLSLSRSVIS